MSVYTGALLAGGGGPRMGACGLPVYIHEGLIPGVETLAGVYDASVYVAEVSAHEGRESVGVYAWSVDLSHSLAVGHASQPLQGVARLGLERGGPLKDRVECQENQAHSGIRAWRLSELPKG